MTEGVTSDGARGPHEAEAAADRISRFRRRPKSPPAAIHVICSCIKPTGDAGREPACRSRQNGGIFQYGQSCRSTVSDRLRPLGAPKSTV